MVVSILKLLCTLLDALMSCSSRPFTRKGSSKGKYAFEGPLHCRAPSTPPHPVDERIQLSRIGAHLPCALGLDVLRHLSHSVLQGVNVEGGWGQTLSIMRMLQEA
jgi:hypothetical protein